MTIPAAYKEVTLAVMAASEVGVCVSVVSGSKVLVRDKILKIPDTTTLAELLEDVKPDGADAADVRVKCLAKPGSTNWIDVGSGKRCWIASQ